MPDASAAATAPPKKKVPSEMLISEQWDACLERLVLRAGTGLIVGGLSAIVLSRECCLFYTVQSRHLQLIGCSIAQCKP